MGNPVQEFFDALAPNWDKGSEDSLSHVLSLLDRLSIKPGFKVLDLACGTGIITGPLHERFGAEVVGLDISSEMIRIAKGKYEGYEGISFEVGDFFNVDFEEKFDWVICHNAFPHFVDADAFVERLYDALKEGGEFVVFHSLGRVKLSKHHDGLGPTISRDLEPVDIEAKRFTKLFEILEADESDTHFWIHGRK